MLAVSEMERHSFAKCPAKRFLIVSLRHSSRFPAAGSVTCKSGAHILVDQDLLWVTDDSRWLFSIPESNPLLYIVMAYKPVVRVRKAYLLENCEAVIILDGDRRTLDNSSKYDAHFLPSSKSTDRIQLVEFGNGLMDK